MDINLIKYVGAGLLSLPAVLPSIIPLATGHIVDFVLGEDAQFYSTYGAVYGVEVDYVEYGP